MNSVSLSHSRIDVLKKSKFPSFLRGFAAVRKLKSLKKSQKAKRPSAREDNEKLKSPDGVFRFGKSNFIVPNQLVTVEDEISKGKDCMLTVFSMRFTTSNLRGSSLSEPNARVSVCLIGQNGKAFLLSIMPVHDPAETHHNLAHIYKMTDARSGANRLLTLKSLRSRKSEVESGSVRRFQQGAIDEVSVLGPDLGPLTAILLGPETGTWNLEEVTISSSRTKHTNKFVCRQKLGDKNTPAVVLRPIPEEAVLYGSRDRAVALTKDKASELRLASLQEYKNFKNNLLVSTVSLVAGGTCLIALIAGDEYVLPFALGGSMGFAYQVLLQKAVDSLASYTGDDFNTEFQKNKNSQAAQSAVEERLTAVMGSATFRALCLGCMATLAVMAIKHWNTGDISFQENAEVATRLEIVQRLLAGLTGFSMYKIANICVALANNTSDEL